jgi:sulfur-oxidizing protein SoxX
LKIGILAASALALTLGAALSVATSSAASELVAYEVVDDAIPQALTDQPGDPVAGRGTAINRKKGNCLACHVLPIPEETFHGEVGPDLSDVGGRLSEGELRLRIVNSKVVNEETIMPAFYRNDGLHRVLEKFQGKTILSAQEVEDVVAYLMTLK